MRRLVIQTQSMQNIVYIDELPDSMTLSRQFSLIVDAVFGFSFSGAIRSPFDTVIATMAAVTIPIVSIDIPSGKSFLSNCMLC